MANDVPLNLSDLVHGMSPEPQLQVTGQNNQQSWQEEEEEGGVDEEEMERIRIRVGELSNINGLLSDREKELVGFVCSFNIYRFPHSISPPPSIRSKDYPYPSARITPRTNYHPKPQPSHPCSPNVTSSYMNGRKSGNDGKAKDRDGIGWLKLLFGSRREEGA